MQRKAAVLLIVIAALVAGGCQTTPSSSGSAVTAIDGAEQWIVIIDDPRSERRKGRASGVGYANRIVYDSDPQLMRVSKEISDDYGIDLLTQWPIRSLDVHCIVVSLPVEESTQLAESLRRDSRVQSVQRLNQFETLSGADPYRDRQVAFDQLHMSNLHDYATGKGVSVAVVDTAVDDRHEDLRRAIKFQVDVIEDATLPMQPERHGTGVASVIAAAVDNGVGVSGIAPDAELVSYRACWQQSAADPKGHCNSLTLSRALDRVFYDKPAILNLSLSGPRDEVLEEQLARITRQGTIVVAAYDEQRGQENRFPSASPGVLFGRDGGNVVTEDAPDVFGAPGTDVLAAQPGQTYETMSGNSFAAAHLSAIIALLLEVQPELDVATIEQLLRTNENRSSSPLAINVCAAVRSLNSAVACSE